MALSAHHTANTVEVLSSTEEFAWLEPWSQTLVRPYPCVVHGEHASHRTINAPSKHCFVAVPFLRSDAVCCCIDGVVSCWIPLLLNTFGS